MLTMPVARHRPTSLIMFFPSLPLKLYSDLTRILLQWVESLWKSISGPKFAYSHLDAPHDARGYLASMDVGLFQHLKNMQRQENTITILMGGPSHHFFHFPVTPYPCRSWTTTWSRICFTTSTLPQCGSVRRCSSGEIPPDLENECAPLSYTSSPLCHSHSFGEPDSRGRSDTGSSGLGTTYDDCFPFTFFLSRDRSKPHM